MPDKIFGMVCIAVASLTIGLGVFLLSVSLIFLLIGGPEGPKGGIAQQTVTVVIYFTGFGLGAIAVGLAVARLGFKRLKRKQKPDSE
jgi:hypothetical protein